MSLVINIYYTGKDGNANISTGVFRFPKDKACRVAVESVKEFLQSNKAIEKVVFNVYSDEDLEIYKEILN